MKKWILLLILLGDVNAFAGSIPGQINYQGTLKESGVPVTGIRNMLFRLTNADGTAVYWSSGNNPVMVAQGIFSTVLSPTGVDWQNVAPSIEVSIEGQVLLPREPVAATVYAWMSGSVIDGAISTAQLANGSVTAAKLDPNLMAYTVPSGLIAIFSGPCPSGWTRFSALDNLFPLGGAAYGTTGGAATHVHSISTDGAHNHGGMTGTASDTTTAVVFASLQGSGSFWSDWGRADHQHAINTDGNHNHGGSTGAGSTIPPYLTVIFCQKQ